MEHYRKNWLRFGSVCCVLDCVYVCMFVCLFASLPQTDVYVCLLACLLASAATANEPDISMYSCIEYKWANMCASGLWVCECVQLLSCIVFQYCVWCAIVYSRTRNAMVQQNTIVTASYWTVSLSWPWLRLCPYLLMCGCVCTHRCNNKAVGGYAFNCVALALL